MLITLNCPGSLLLLLFNFKYSPMPTCSRGSVNVFLNELNPCWTSLVAQLVKNPPAMRETWVQSLGWEDPLEKERLPTPVFFWPGEFHGL